MARNLSGSLPQHAGERPTCSAFVIPTARTSVDYSEDRPLKPAMSELPARQGYDAELFIIAKGVGPWSTS